MRADIYIYIKDYAYIHVYITEYSSNIWPGINCSARTWKLTLNELIMNSILTYERAALVMIMKWDALSGPNLT